MDSAQKVKLPKPVQQKVVGKRPRATKTSTNPPEDPWRQTEHLTKPGRMQDNQHGTAPVQVAQGKTKQLMSPHTCVNFHPFAETLQQWEEGVPVDCGEDWTLEQIEAAIKQGPHKLALDPESIALIEEDVAYEVRAGYAEVVDWSKLRRQLPQQLKVSPLAVVPQHNHRGHMIPDLSFPVVRQSIGKGKKQKKGDPEVLQQSVNDATVRMA
jgi:hypothetical protein